MPPTAIVMNMFYTGLGIARSLGEQGIPVIGLSAQRGIYGNYTRYAKRVSAPDSRHEPDALLQFLIAFGKKLDHKAVIFPTRDDDLLFLNRFRMELSANFILASPEGPALHACLDKWETWLWAQKAQVAAPKCWLIEGEGDLSRIDDLTFPCVLKPLAAHHWRQGKNWALVGNRKAIGISSREELISEYALIARADKRALLQEMVPGGDECLLIAACYLDRQSNYVAGFNTQKLVQSPEGFGTGCIVQAADRPELVEPTARLLKAMGFTGIAEVEYKWNADKREYQLIEVNPRPWDQHRLGNSCGVDLIYLAYCDYAGLPRPAVRRDTSAKKWIAEDTFITTALLLLRRRSPKFRDLFRLARGERIYAVWSAKDPLPFCAYMVVRFIPELINGMWRAAWSGLKRKLSRKEAVEKGAVYGGYLEKGKSLR